VTRKNSTRTEGRQMKTQMVQTAVTRARCMRRGVPFCALNAVSATFVGAVVDTVAVGAVGDAPLPPSATATPVGAST
jgi:hypothetical protein